MGCKRSDGCIICVLFQIIWQLQTQIVKNRILIDSLLGNKLYQCRLLITFTNRLNPDQARKNDGPDLDPNCLTDTLMIFLKEN